MAGEQDDFLEDEPTVVTTDDPEIHTEKDEIQVGDAEDDGYGERVQKRINKEVARRKAAEEQRQAAEDRIAQLEERFAKLSNSLHERDARATEAQAKSEEDRMQAHYEATKLKYRKAVEEVDVEAQAQMLDELLEAREKLSNARERSRIKAESPPPPAEPAYRPGSAAVPAGAKSWMERNTWFSDPNALRDPKLKARADLALALDSALQIEGFSPHDTEMYDELDRRLNAALGGQRKQKGNGGGGVGASYDGGGNDAPGEKRLTREDLENMRNFGFDPNKPADRKAWLTYRDD